MYHKNSMATASLIFGILAILSGSVFIIAIGLGALSVLCALLSEDRPAPFRKEPCRNARRDYCRCK